MTPYLLKQKIKKGHIAILGQSSYEWIVAYFGVALAGMVVIPLDKELSTNEINDLIIYSREERKSNCGIQTKSVKGDQLAAQLTMSFYGLLTDGK